MERYNKGIGICNKIIGILKEISFGYSYFEMAALFRQSLLLNSILCNSEVLYGLNNEHINTLEAVDKYYWRKVFGAPISTLIESFYLETNSIPIRFILMGRRLMYLWTILSRDDSDLVKKYIIPKNYCQLKMIGNHKLNKTCKLVKSCCQKMILRI